MTRLRLLFLHSVPFSPISGENLRGRALLAELSRRGHAIDVVSPVSSGIAGLPGVRHLKLGSVNRFRKSRIFQHLGFGALARVRGVPRRAPDLVYCFGLAGTPAALAAAHRHRSPLVTDLYEVDYPALRPESGAVSRLILAAANRWTTRALSRSTSVLALSSPLGKLAAALGAVSVQVFHDFAESRFRPAPDAARGDPVIGFHGGVYERDGLDLLIEAAAPLASCPAFKIRVHGRGPALDTIARTARRCRFPADRLELPGWVPYEDLPAAVSRFTFAAVPMRKMPVNELVVPRKLFEYMRAGIPFVTAGLSAVRDFFTDREAIFYRCGDVPDLTARLAELLDRPQRARELSRRLLERGRNCSLDSECAKIADHLEAVAGGTR